MPLWTLLLACVNLEGDEAGECSDLADNDQDGYIDCEDAGCWDSPDCAAPDTDADTDAEGDADADSDADSDTDADSDADSDADTDADADTDLPAVHGAVGELSRVQPVGGYWSSTPDTTAHLMVYFLESGSFEHARLWSEGLDNCALDYTASGDEVALFDPGVSSIALSGSSDLSVPWDPSGLVFQEAVSTGSVGSDGSWTLERVSGEYAQPFEVVDFVRTASAPSVSSPAIEGSSPPTINRGHTFTWQAPDADYVLLDLQLSDANQSSVEARVSCAVSNTGSFTVPSATWDSWPTGRVVYVRVGSVRLATGTLPSGQPSQVAGVMWVLGGAFSG